MANKRLSDLAIERMHAPEAGRMQVYDALVPGLVLRVSSTARTWSYMYRINGMQRRLSLGEWPGVGVALARDRAGDAAKMVQRGEDPVAVRKAEKEKAQEAPPASFADVADAFVDKYAKVHQKRWQETKRLLDKLAKPKWKDKAAVNITEDDVDELLAEVAESTPIQANRLRAALSKLFNWARRPYKLHGNPVKDTEAPAPERSRERALTDSEIVELWRAATRLGNPFGHAAKLMLALGQRRELTADAQRPHFDMEHRLWVIPASVMKADQPHAVPLNDIAVAVLDSVPVVHVPDTDPPKPSPWLFTTNGTTPSSGWSKAKTQLDAFVLAARRKEMEEHGADPADAKPMTPWQFRDLRRTVATNLARLGCPNEVVARILAHSQRRLVGVTAIYQRHRYDDEAAHWLDAWSKRLQLILSRAEGSNVIPLPLSSPTSA